MRPSCLLRGRLSGMSLRTSTVDIQTADGTADAFLAAPDDGARHPGVLLYMDAFGPRPRLEDMADAARRAGVRRPGAARVLPRRAGHRWSTPRRCPTPTPAAGCSSRSRRGCGRSPRSGRCATPTPTSTTSATTTRSTAGPIGVTGYCMGGALALRTAAEHPGDVGAAAAFHPARLATDAPDSPHLLADRIEAEVYVASADQDQSHAARAAGAARRGPDRGRRHPHRASSTTAPRTASRWPTPRSTTRRRPSGTGPPCSSCSAHAALIRVDRRTRWAGRRARPCMFASRTSSNLEADRAGT